MLVTHSGKRRVMELREKPRTRRHEVPQMLLSSDAVTRIQGAAQQCPGGPDSPIELLGYTAQKVSNRVASATVGSCVQSHVVR